MRYPLGPLQALWDAWSPAQELLVTRTHSHFSRTVDIQLDEIRQHLEEERGDKVVNEIIDIMSVSLNWLRAKYQLTDHQIADAIRGRAARHEKEGTREIVARYKERYDL